MTAPAILVATAQQARHASATAAGMGMTALLVTAPEACARLGPGYLLEAIRQAGSPPALLDCGSDPGWAMLALRLGWRDLHLAGPPHALAPIAAMAAARGARFHAALPAAFDLAADPAGLAPWLARHGAAGLSPPPGGR